MGLTETIAEWATHVLEQSGYAGLALLMTLESMIAPVPSEAVMPFAGFLVVQGAFSLEGAVLASSAGTLIGSWLGYLMGRFGGYPVVERWGRYLLLNRGHLEWTAKWFERRGEITILVSRFIPIVRHFISIPAGVARMSPWRFSLYTLIGGTTWNCILLWTGMELRERWDSVQRYSHQVDIAVVVILAATLIWWVRRQLKAR